MTDTEMDAFEEQAHYDNAVRLRKWDDRAKKESLPVPPLETYRETIARLLKARG
jgi:predicted HD phosphohydrolase